MASHEAQMPDYGEILQFLAKNPPQLASERHLHASLLELLANCLRGDAPIAATKAPDSGTIEQGGQVRTGHRWVHFN